MPSLSPIIKLLMGRLMLTRNEANGEWEVNKEGPLPVVGAALLYVLDG